MKMLVKEWILETAVAGHGSMFSTIFTKGKSTVSCLLQQIYSFVVEHKDENYFENIITNIHVSNETELVNTLVEVYEDLLSQEGENVIYIKMSPTTNEAEEYYLLDNTESSTVTEKSTFDDWESFYRDHKGGICFYD